MKRVALGLFIAAAIAGPSAAQPIPPVSETALNCLLEGASAEQRAAAGSAASQRLTDAPADGEQRGGTALTAILAALPRCAEANRWTERQRMLARHYVLAQLTREDMRRRYAAENADLAFIDEAVASARPGEALPFEALVARLRAQGIGDSRPDSAGDIVYLYVELAGQIAAIRAGFNDPNFNPG